ncbi:hypothetical protein [Pseudoxanthomonas koreensis]|uniref:hypothetical protein n=1 Tax=Pseudoxanthomonas koreensis TaxID=266061 RepID=UPI0035A67534
MPTSPRSSHGSAPCRLEWRPSRWLLAALLTLSLLAPLAVLGSGLPRLLAWPLALAAAIGGGVRAWREAGRAPRQLVLGTGSGPDVLDGQPLQACELAWRGPLAFIHALDAHGRSHRLVWWPDTLPPPRRRELRLVAALRAASRPTRSMAP